MSFNKQQPDLVALGRETTASGIGALSPKLRPGPPPLSSRPPKPITDVRGKYMEIPIGLLRLEKEYQREQLADEIEKKRYEFSWIACGCLIVGVRNGIHYVIDGGTRFLAAKARGGIDTLDCMVYPTVDAAEEAKAFLMTNVGRKPVPASSNFRASIVARDPSALSISRIINRAGYVISRAETGPCIGFAPYLVRKWEEDPSSLEAILGLCIAIAQGEPLNMCALGGLLYLEKRMPPGTSLTSSVYKGKLSRLGTAGLHAAAKAGVAFLNKGGERSWAIGIEKAVNSGLRTNRLRIFDTGA